MGKVYLNGKILLESKAKLSVFDRGFLYGDGIFETLRTYNGVPFLLKEHLKRLKQAGRATKIKVPTGLEKAVESLIKAQNLKNKDFRIRLTLSRGVDKENYELKSNLTPTVLITATPINKKEIEKTVTKGIYLSTATLPSLALEGIKSTNLLKMILAKQSTKVSGYQDILCLNKDNNITETLTGNIFLVVNNTLITPPLESGILPGITRGYIIKMAKRNSLKVAEKQIKLSNLLSCQEVFTTNSINGITPVTKIDNRKFSIGQTTILLQDYYNKQIERL